MREQIIKTLFLSYNVQHVESWPIYLAGKTLINVVSRFFLDN